MKKYEWFIKQRQKKIALLIGKKKKIRSLTHNIHKTIHAKYLHMSKQSAGASPKRHVDTWTRGHTHGCPLRMLSFQDEIKNNI